MCCLCVLQLLDYYDTKEYTTIEKIIQNFRFFWTGFCMSVILVILWLVLFGNLCCVFVIRKYAWVSNKIR